MNNTAKPQPEFTHLVRFSEVGDGRKKLVLEADAAALKAVCNRLGILDVLKIEADVALYWVNAESLILSDADEEIEGEILCFEAVLRAKVSQACVLTLEPVVADIERKFTRHFGEGDPRDMPKEGYDLEIFEGDGQFAQIEIVGNARIDVADIVVEELALSLDPYPRAEGATLESELKDNGHGDIGTTESPPEPRKNPFSVLEKLKNEMAEKNRQ